MNESAIESGEYTHDHKIKVQIDECGEPLETLNPEEFVLEPMYFKWGHTDTSEIKLRKGVIERLIAAQKLLQPMGLLLKIWDGYRTLKTQKILYDEYYERLHKQHSDWNDEHLRKAVEIFVSPPSHDPKYPAPHNTGGAVDLTLIDAEGNEIDMGTPFDEFNERSFTNHFEENGGEIHKNRMLFKKIMEEAGFVNYFEEWWHFSYGDQEWAKAKGELKAVYGSMEI